MGSCTSTVKTSKPLKIAHRPSPAQDENNDEEEVKSPEKYCMPSSDLEGYQNKSTKEKGDKGQVGTADYSRMSSRDLTRKQSEFNLHRDLMEALKNDERLKKQEGPLDLLKDKVDATPYRISKDQHYLIYKFVEEKNRMIQDELSKLHSHLIRNVKEGEDLPFIMESLRQNNKDVENCLDDLRVYPVPNEITFYKTIDQNHQLVKEVFSRYKNYKDNSKGYWDFRETTLKLVKQYDVSQQDTGISEETPEPKQLMKRENSETKSKYLQQEVRGSDGSYGDGGDVQGGYNLTFQNPWTQDLRSDPYKTNRVNDIELTLSQELNNEILTYNKIKEDFDSLEKRRDMIVQKYATLQKELKSTTQEKDSKIVNLRQSLLKDVQIEKQHYDLIESQVHNALMNMEHYNLTYQSPKLSSDLKILQTQIKQKKPELDKLEEEIQMTLSKSMSSSQKIRSLTGNKPPIMNKFDNPKMFFEKKPISHPKLEKKQGDNPETDPEGAVDLISNEESPNLDNKLEKLKSVDTRPEHLTFNRN